MKRYNYYTKPGHALMNAENTWKVKRRRSNSQLLLLSLLSSREGHLVVTTKALTITSSTA
eukprot:c33319_g1_i1 orf=3-179(-)